MINVKINFDKSMPKDFIKIEAKEENEIIKKIESYISDYYPNTISCFKNNQLYRIAIADIVIIFCEGSSVFLETLDQKYEIKDRLYVLEKKLFPFSFVKINKGELVNINMVEFFDFTFSGKILINLKNKKICTVSRRSIKKIKQMLGV